MWTRRLGAVAIAIACLGGPAAADTPPEEWEYAMERQLLPDRVRLLIDGETALEGHMRFVGDRPQARVEGDFRGHALDVRCRRNPLVHALNCFVRVDGEVRSNHVVVQ
ncbi:hypothetical protein [Aquisalimonas asiatica]|uniref:Uncharacterized protein n=1 Tax=Aquisalimonas asiatica TaxID=406100 RepID=A0A1H8TFH1_9GAMM|nr:hypothetical protein [Aquisalimonas asiatica]SEO89677.1 hypothetical protein SAMN04488052_104137 [Aquisalimonas asiatica]